LSSINVIWKLIVYIDAIKLPRRHVILCAPALSVVESYCGTAIVGDDEVIGVVGVDPEIMKIPWVPERVSQVLPPSVERRAEALIT